jgi:hypothetical protein
MSGERKTTDRSREELPQTGISGHGCSSHRLAANTRPKGAPHEVEDAGGDIGALHRHECAYLTSAHSTSKNTIDSPLYSNGVYLTFNSTTSSSKAFFVLCKD